MLSTSTKLSALGNWIKVKVKDLLPYFCGIPVAYTYLNIQQIFI